MKHWFVILLAVILCSCQSAPPHHGISHTVIFWLKDRGNQVHRNKLIAATQQLRKIPGVFSITVGECLPSSRGVVDSSYDVAATMTFADSAALQDYLNHPEHKAAGAMLKPLIKKTTVFDFHY